MKWTKSKRRVALHTDDSTSFEGLLVDVRHGHYHLADVSLLGAVEGVDVKLNHDVQVPASTVRFVEYLTR